MLKSRCYSTSASADIRVAGAVLSDNEGHKHLMLMETNWTIPTGLQTQKFAEQQDYLREKRREKNQLKKSKARRIHLKNQREQLRKKNEGKEGVTYQRNCGIVLEDTNSSTVPSLDIETWDFARPFENCQLVYFDLETSGFGRIRK